MTTEEALEYQMMYRNPQGLSALNNYRNATLGLSMAQNLAPQTSLGFLLGNLGGNMINNYLANRQADQINQDYQNWKNLQTGQRLFGNNQNLPQQSQMKPSQVSTYQKPTLREILPNLGNNQNSAPPPFNPSYKPVSLQDFTQSKFNPALRW
ncbi:MAG: hypothetical protein IJT73_07395 [Selenomonadaceae bacterium]|nr:hypothetical protein [Selenomonadaceae bacterium]